MSSEDVAKFKSTINIVEKDVYKPSISLDTKNKNSTYLQDDYDPFQHRDVVHPISDLRAFANLVKSVLGTGVLALPIAFSHSGYVVGLVGTVIIGYLCTHAVAVFVKVSQQASTVLRTPSLGYAETCEAVVAIGPKSLRKWSTPAKIFADWAMAFTYLGTCSVYTVLMMSQLKNIIEGFHPEFVVQTGYYSIVFIIPLAFLIQIKKLKDVALFSAIANVLMVVIVGICLYFILVDYESLNFYEIKMTNDLSRFPLFLTTVIFAMEGIGVVMPVENEMKKPQRFLGCPGVLNISMVFIVMLYSAIGLLGYMKYQDHILGSITLNLPHGNVLAICAKVFIVVAIFFSYMLKIYVPAEVVWRNFQNSFSSKRHGMWQTMIRLILLLLTFIAGSLLPKLDQIIGLISAIFYSILGLIIPCLAETIYEWDRNLGKFNWKLWKNVLIILVALISLVFGSMQSINLTN